MRKFFGVILTALISGQTVHAAFLNDIATSSNASAIMFLNERGIIGGYPDGSFKPKNILNRAELLKILVGGAGVNPTVEQYSNCFPDVGTEWFAPFICYAAQVGWVSGYPDGTFKPASTVNKVEAIKMLVNSQNYSTSDVTSYLYNDVESGTWFAPYVAAAKDRNLLEEQTGNLGVTHGMTREKISEYIYRAMYIKEKRLDRYTSDNSNKNERETAPPVEVNIEEPVDTLTDEENTAATLKIADWVGGAEVNIQTMESEVEIYSQSSSHYENAREMRRYIMDYRGVIAKLEQLMSISKERNLTYEEYDEVSDLFTETNTIINKFNNIFGPSSY